MLWASLLAATVAIGSGSGVPAQETETVPATEASPSGESGVVEVPPTDTVPIPDERPDQPDDVEPKETETPAGAAGTGANSGETPDAGVAGGADASESGAAPDAEGDDAADRPISEIPVPEDRPAGAAPAPDASSPETLPATVPETGAGAVPPEAPNSPEKLKARVSDVTPEQSVMAAAAIEDALACEADLTRRGVTFTVKPTISEGACGVLRPVAIERLSSGVVVSPDTQMLCRTALALDDWMTSGVVPEAKRRFPSETLTEFRHASTYVCRPRASETAISEHARGSAVDVAAFVLDGTREIGIVAGTPSAKDADFLQAVRTSACGPFTTVLGPGTDADHATHFHLDIAARGKGATYCK